MAENRMPCAASSRIDHQGRYMPGVAGVTHCRARNTADILAQYPAVRRLFESNPASVRFHQLQLLSYEDFLGDGFRARYSREMLLVDARVDKALRRFTLHIRRCLEDLPTSDMSEHVSAVARIVVNAFGGCCENGEGAQLYKRWSQRLDELCTPPPADLLIGHLLGGPAVGRREPGVGVCRHRAILLKYMCDALNICECALLTGVVVPAGTQNIASYRKKSGSSIDHMWNIVRIDKRPFVVDCSFFPGELQPAEFILGRLSKHVEYHRIGGGAGIFSLGMPQFTPRSSMSSSCSNVEATELSLDTCLTRRSVQQSSQMPSDSAEDLFLMTKGSLEHFGDVEVSAEGPSFTCLHCYKEVCAHRIQPRRCRHVFHVECLLLFWEDGTCPYCGQSFAPTGL